MGESTKKINSDSLSIFDINYIVWRQTHEKSNSTHNESEWMRNGGLPCDECRGKGGTGMNECHMIATNKMGSGNSLSRTTHIIR